MALFKWPFRKDWDAHAEANRQRREELRAAGWTERPITELWVGATFLTSVSDSDPLILQSEFEQIEDGDYPRLAATVDNFSSLTGTAHRERREHFGPDALVWVKP